MNVFKATIVYVLVLFFLVPAMAIELDTLEIPTVPIEQRVEVLEEILRDNLSLTSPVRDAIIGAIQSGLVADYPTLRGFYEYARALENPSGPCEGPGNLRSEIILIVDHTRNGYSHDRLTSFNLEDGSIHQSWTANAKVGVNPKSCGYRFSNRVGPDLHMNGPLRIGGYNFPGRHNFQLSGLASYNCHVSNKAEQTLHSANFRSDSGTPGNAYPVAYRSKGCITCPANRCGDLLGTGINVNRNRNAMKGAAGTFLFAYPALEDFQANLPYWDEDCKSQLKSEARNPSYDYASPSQLNRTNHRYMVRF